MPAPADREKEEKKAIGAHEAPMAFLRLEKGRAASSNRSDDFPCEYNENDSHC
jgi:hypothetical protein